MVQSRCLQIRDQWPYFYNVEFSAIEIENEGFYADRQIEVM